MAPPKLQQKRSCKAKKKLGVDEKSRTGDFKKRKTTLKNKARQLQTLCDVKVCMVCVGSDGEVVTWPETKTQVESIINEYNRGLLGGKSAEPKEKQKLDLSSFLASNREKLEEKLNKREELQLPDHEAEAIKKVFSGLVAKLSELSEGDLRSLCSTLDCKLQFLREKIELLQSMEKENADHVFNGKNLERNYTYLTESHQLLLPLLEFDDGECCYANQPIDDGSSNLLSGANTTVLSGKDSTNNFGTNIYTNFLLSQRDNLETNMYQKECQQPLLPLGLLGECCYSSQLISVGSSNPLLGIDTSVLLGGNDDHCSAGNADNIPLLDNYFPCANVGFSSECT